jgi:hypothetical protein
VILLNKFLFLSFTCFLVNRYYTIDWGTEHDCYLTVPPGKRAEWSSKELAYLERFLAEGKGSGNYAAKCLKQIIDDESAHAIFHLNHTLDTGRIKSGFDRLKSLKRSGQKV